MLAEWRHGAARGARRRRDADARHRHRRRASSCGGAAGARRRAAAAAEIGHMVVELDGPPCQGDCPGRGCTASAFASGNAIGARRARRARAAARLARSAARWTRGREITGRARHRARARRRRGRARGDRRASAARSALGMVTLVNIFNPEVVVVGGGAIAAGELLLGPARARGRPSARCRSLRDARARSCPRASAPTPGMLGAAMLAFEELGAGERRHERAAGRLPDADRQPRGHHAARARRAARGRRDRVRGHAHDARCCSTATASSAERVRYDEHTERRAAPRAGRADARGRDRRAGQRRRDAARQRPGASCSCRRASRPGSRSRCCPGPSAALTALVASGLPADDVALRGLPAAQARRAARRAARAEETLVAFESPRRVGATLAVLAGARPRAAGRGLPRADEAPRGGRARDGRRAGRALRGARRRAARSCS